MDKNRIEGAAKQGERAMNRKALVIKAKRRKSGGCAVKECVLTWGGLALCLKGRLTYAGHDLAASYGTRENPANATLQPRPCGFPNHPP